jgi:methyl-accepting chemotaxis protein
VSTARENPLMLATNSPSIGRFDKSFLVHMIKDFFLVLLAVTMIEFTFKAVGVFYNYSVNGATQAQAVADDLAENVRSIMRNEGGPVAARTMYPILQKNWAELGYSVAIVPSDVTIRSIKNGFDFVPAGIPEFWPEGEFKEAAVQITAEAFCLSCHTEARVGDVLGTVIVHNYLERDFAIWFEQIRLAAGFALAKIVLHSVLLFLILRARMEPLLRLRSVVSNLSKAYSALDQRAEIRTEDEFGALAYDLNIFLDRINRLIAELNQVLLRVVAVNDDIVTVQSDLRGQIDRVVTGVRRLERDAMIAAKREPRLSNDWFKAIRTSVQALDDKLAQAGEIPQAGELLEALRTVVGHAETQLETSEKVFERLAAVGDDTENLRGAMAEMTRLEERMKTIIETGGTLVRRLQPEVGQVV